MYDCCIISYALRKLNKILDFGESNQWSVVSYQLSVINYQLSVVSGERISSSKDFQKNASKEKRALITDH